MTELKTLKDIGVSSSDFTDEELNNINLRLLSKTIALLKEKERAEAVKWVKKLQQMIKDEVYNTEKLSSNLDIFMEFFNLTEKEIQDA